jgi:hypothetical protein
MRLRHLHPNAAFVFTDGCGLVEVIPEPGTIAIPGVDINGAPLRPAGSFGRGAGSCKDCHPYTHCCWCGFEYPAPVPSGQDFLHDHLNEEET